MKNPRQQHREAFNTNNELKTTEHEVYGIGKYEIKGSNCHSLSNGLNLENVLTVKAKGRKEVSFVKWNSVIIEVFIELNVRSDTKMANEILEVI